MKNLKFLLTFLSVFTLMSVKAQTTVPSADAILKEARLKAGKENKNIFVIYHASWCTWCHKLDTAMNDVKCRKYFNDNYITVHLTVLESPKKVALENPGALELMKKHGGDKLGLPYYAILDKAGMVLGDARIILPDAKPSEPTPIIGYPSAELEVDAFKKLLKKTSRLEDREIIAIVDRFSELKAK